MRRRVLDQTKELVREANNEIKRGAPVQTGRLRRGFEVDSDGLGISNDVPYLRIVEARRGFIRRALRKVLRGRRR